MTDKRLFHLAERPLWDAAVLSGTYRADSLATEGFIHLSTAAQLVKVANHFYRGRTDLIALIIDPRALDAPVVFDRVGDEVDVFFPHLYGPLNVSAVTKSVHVVPSSDGTFSFAPEQL